MLTYIYVQKFIRGGLGPRNLDITVRVYRIKNNKPIFIGKEDWNTSSWPGAIGVAKGIIAQKEGFKMSKYGFVRKDISVIEVG